MLNLWFFQGYAQSDTPCGAPFLAVNTDSCGYVAGTTDGATYQNDVFNGGTPPCASPGSPDVWYRIIVPVSRAIAITTKQGTITDGGMAVYTGDCNNLTLIGCNDEGAGNMMPVIDRSDFVAGDTIYIRFWKAWGTTTGTFNTCVIESHSDCISATFLCNDKHFPKCTYGPGSHFDAFSDYNCGITEYQSQWLTFNFLTSGTFIFTIFPDTLAPGIFPDYDWMLFQNNNSFCNVYDSSYAPLICNASSSQGLLGSTGLDSTGVSNNVPAGPGNHFCPVLNVNAGDNYYLFINNFSISSSGYSITFDGTALMNCNQIVGVAQQPETPFSINIYPNPATSNIIIETEQKSVPIAIGIEIISIEGQTIESFRAVNNKTTIDLTNFSRGVYIMRAKTDKDVVTLKFIKE